MVCLIHGENSQVLILAVGDRGRILPLREKETPLGFPNPHLSDVARSGLHT